MFARITLDNFLSFDRIDFDMRGKGGKPLNHLLIYGENGSGKTNLIESVSFLKESVNTLGPIPEDCQSDSGSDTPRPWNIDLAMFSKSRRMIGSDDPMVVRYLIVIDGKEYEYEMSVGSDGFLIREQMRAVLSKRVGKLFSISMNRGKVKMIFNDTMFRSSSYRSEIEDSIRKYWGRHTFLAILNHEYGTKNSEYLIDMARPDVFRLLDFIASTVTNVRSPVPQPNSTVGFNPMNGMIVKSDLKFLKAYESALSRFFSRLYSDVVGVRYIMTEINSSYRYELIFDKRIAGKVRSVPCSSESAGTRVLVTLFPSLIGCADGQVAFIDELDSGVHDKLIYDLITQILPDLRGQLVITTHNTSLLEFIGPNNAYILDVDNEGFKDIYPISKKEKTQRNNNNRIRYINGQFNGVPIIGYIDLAGISESFRKDVGL